MEKIKIFSMKSPYREAFHISGYVFSSGEKSVAIMGAKVFGFPYVYLKTP